MLSKLLEAAERECVCGDLEELRVSAPEAAMSILGLAMRRQLAEWSRWGPWLALVGVTGVAGFYLSRSVGDVATAVNLQIGTYFKYGVAYQCGGVSLAQEIAYAATLASSMLLWSWACGFVLASLSRRALPITAFLFYCVVRDSWVVRLALAGNIVLKHGHWETMLFRLLPLDPIAFAFLAALALGIGSARRRTLALNRRLVVTCAGVTLVLLLAWMQSWFTAGFAHWSGRAYLATPLPYRMLPILAGAWPVFSIPLLGRRLHSEFCSKKDG